MSKSIRVALAALALLGLASAAQAQAKAASSSAGSLTWFASADLALPQADLNTATNVGFGANFGGHYALAPEWGIRADFQYQTFSIKSPGTGSYSLYGVSVMGQYDISMDGAFKPYVIGGGGFYTNSCTGCNSEWKFGFGGGVGGAWMMGSQTWFAELRYHTVSTSGVTIAWMPIAFGLRF